MILFFGLEDAYTVGNQPTLCFGKRKDQPINQDVDGLVEQK
jgi:hypothetical protein